MIDIRDLRDNPEKYRVGARNKNYDAGLVDELLAVDAELRELIQQRESLVAEKNQIGKQIGQIAGKLKKAEGDEKAALQQEMARLQERPNAMKTEQTMLDNRICKLEPKRDAILLELPLPADEDVPVGKSADDNVEIRQWLPDGFDPAKPFAKNKGFAPKSHIDLMAKHGMVDFERGVKMAGSRSYVLTGAGMLLHNAVLQYAFNFMTTKNGFQAMSVPVLVREQCMQGTGFFPHGREQAYAVGDVERLTAKLRDHTDDTLVTEEDLATKNDGYLTGTGEVGLMGYHADEILDAETLPRCYTTVSTCFRREAGAAGKDTAGLYRIHQFDKVEQVVICKADEQESRAWHQKMIGFVEQLLQGLGLPYRLLQCCTGDLGPKNADMIDIECWMPSRGEEGADGLPTGDWGETHSASRLYDFQTRRLNLRYKDPDTGKNVFCHSLNNTVAASPRLLIPIVEMYQNEDGSITVPEALRPWMGGMERIG